MPQTTYQYTISTDFPGGVVDTNVFAREIEDSSIATALVRIDTFGDNIDIVFVDALSAGDKTTLDGDTTGPAGGLIALHPQAPIPSSVTPTIFAGSVPVQSLFIELTVDTTTNGKSFSELLSLTFDTQAGSYLEVLFTASVDASNGSRDAQFRIKLDGVVEKGMNVHLHQSGDPNSGAMVWKSDSPLAAGSHTVRIEWKRGQQGTTLGIRPVSDPNTEHASLLVRELC